MFSLRNTNPFLCGTIIEVHPCYLLWEGSGVCINVSFLFLSFNFSEGEWNWDSVFLLVIVVKWFQMVSDGQIIS